MAKKAITFYLNKREKTEENPKGVIAASFMDEWGEVIQYCTADICLIDDEGNTLYKYK